MAEPTQVTFTVALHAQDEELRCIEVALFVLNRVDDKTRLRVLTYLNDRIGGKDG